jgi:hypothetical protein
MSRVTANVQSKTAQKNRPAKRKKARGKNSPRAWLD